MLEFVGAIDVNSTEQRVLDKLKVEKDRGITVKAQTCSLIYRCAKDGKDYLLNLIDTPGHVDFCSEVSRSISACQGVLLLVDANQGKEIRGTFCFAYTLGLLALPKALEYKVGPNASS